jgi:serine/threonine protein kinase/cytochrome c-type biogenesis protein CcmH/NrfG
MALPIGTILDGKFKIVQNLGEGGMGTVYKVEQIGLPPGRSPYYAVKELLISPNTSEEDRKAAIERFHKEIDLLRDLKHPRIAALMRPFQDRGNYYFAMEFVSGRSLEKILEDTKNPLPEEQIIRWMIQVCEALTYIHTLPQPVILRDLKPGNIMITAQNEVQLIDFGIARRFDPNKRTNTENLGTISYASPEHLGSITAPGQRRSARNPGRLVQTDARSDIYSLGATMYHLLTGYEPDPIQTPAPGSILAKNPRLRTIMVNNRRICPIEQVIIKAMQQDRDQRFQSAEAMRVALNQCLPGQAAPSTIQIPAISASSTIVVPATNGSAPAASNGSVCPRCGLLNRPGAKFCKRDGQPLVAGVAVPPQIRAQPARVPIQARPIQARPVQSRPSQPIRPRPIQPRPVSTPARPGNAIRPRPVSPPAVATATPPASAAVILRDGLLHLGNKRYTEAIQLFTRALNAGASTYDAKYNLGRAHRQYGQSLHTSNPRQASEEMKRAAELFEEAVRIKPDALDAYFQLGMCYRDLKLPGNATSAFKKALALAPQDPAVYYQLGMSAIEQNFYREAEGHFQDGLQINPDHALILIALGRLYIETNKSSAAISVLRQATQRDAMLWEGWYELGRAHIKQKEWKFALSALERARQAGPAGIDVYNLMAMCYLKLNRKTDARSMVDEALRRDPKNAETLRLQKQL